MMRVDEGEIAFVPSGVARRMLGVTRQRVSQLVSEGKVSGFLLAGRLMVSRRSVEARLALLEKEANEDERGW